MNAHTQARIEVDREVFDSRKLEVVVLSFFVERDLGELEVKNIWRRLPSFHDLHPHFSNGFGLLVELNSILHELQALVPRLELQVNHLLHSRVLVIVSHEPRYLHFFWIKVWEIIGRSEPNSLKSRRIFQNDINEPLTAVMALELVFGCALVEQFFWRMQLPIFLRQGVGEDLSPALRQLASTQKCLYVLLAGLLILLSKVE